jgi:hypothetical protein
MATADTTHLLRQALARMDELQHKMSALEAREARERADAHHRADAARHLTSREHLMELDAEKRKYQARCDAALETWRQRAPPPVIDESVDDYRFRLAKVAQKRLPDDHPWRNKKLRQLWNNGFNVENDIYRDAAGERPDSAPPVSCARSKRSIRRTARSSSSLLARAASSTI